jgi:hypothetical protein
MQSILLEYSEWCKQVIVVEAQTGFDSLRSLGSPVVDHALSYAGTQGLSTQDFLQLLLARRLRVNHEFEVPWCPHDVCQSAVDWREYERAGEAHIAQYLAGGNRREPATASAFMKEAVLRLRENGLRFSKSDTDEWAAMRSFGAFDVRTFVSSRKGIFSYWHSVDLGSGRATLESFAAWCGFSGVTRFSRVPDDSAPLRVVEWVANFFSFLEGVGRQTI